MLDLQKYYVLHTEAKQTEIDVNYLLYYQKILELLAYSQLQLNKFEDARKTIFSSLSIDVSYPSLVLLLRLQICRGENIDEILRIFASPFSCQPLHLESQARKQDKNSEKIEAP